MTMKTNLYILVFPEKQVFKIGKANDIHQRIDTLKRWWGQVNYAESYYLEADEAIVFGLEKTLHFLLDGHSVAFEEGDGRTELFKLSELPVVLRYMEIYMHSPNNRSLSLKKGIDVPIKPAKAGGEARGKKFSRTKATRFFASIESCTAKFKKAHKIVDFLVRNSDRIKYQYDVIDSHILFRIERTGIARRFDSSGIFRLFGFSVDDYTGSLHTNTCSFCGSGDIVQVKVRIRNQDNEHFRHEYLEYMFGQLMAAFKRVPKRSMALSTEIPILDEMKIWDEIMEGWKQEQSR